MKFWNMKKTDKDNEMLLEISGDITMEQDLWDWLLDKPDRSATALEAAIKAAAGRNITVWINSNGGNCAAASVIYSALMEHRETGGRVSAKINTAISAASVIAMAAEDVYMSPTGIMMIHNPWTIAEGEAKDMQLAAEILDQVKESIINAYVLKTGLDRATISDLMDAETWMSAQKAVELGFADAILFDDESEPDEHEAKALITGARAVYASIPREKFAAKLEEFLEAEREAEKKAADEAARNAARERIRLERARF